MEPFNLYRSGAHSIQARRWRACSPSVSARAVLAPLAAVPAYQIIAWASELQLRNAEQPRGAHSPRHRKTTAKPTQARVAIPCPICGKPFTPRNKGQGVVSTYCSLQCAGAAKRSRKAETTGDETTPSPAEVDPPAAEAAAPL